MRSDWEVPSFEINEISPKKTEYCIGIPLLNEGEKILKELAKMKELGISELADIIIFDGGSCDGSTDLEKLASFGVRTLLVKKGPGKQGAQFRMGFSYLINQGYLGVVTIDGNNKDGVEAIPLFIEKLMSGYDFIQGSRFIPGGFHLNTPLFRYIAVRFVHAPLISVLSQFHYTDTTSAYRGISTQLLVDKKLDIFRNIFSAYELLFYMSVTAPRVSEKVCEIPVSRVYPNKGNVPTKISWFGNVKILWVLFKLIFGHYKARV
jgi:dolichol-phosphate mannosyltransferase